MTEIIGYTGSALVAVSLMMSNIWKLRWINMAGAVFFVLYGLAMKVYPIVAVNAFIVVVDAYYLIQMARKKDFFSLMTVKNKDEALIKHFLSYHSKDIFGVFPDFNIEDVQEPHCIFILRNLMPVGLFVYVTKQDTVYINLDYVIPEYRDLKNARYLYKDRAKHFKNQGFKTFQMRTESKEHARYLQKLGFSPSASEPNLCTKKI